jgi:aquaporin Z
MLVGGKALAQLWMFLLIPSIAGLVAGGLYRANVLSIEEPKAKAAAAR